MKFLLLEKKENYARYLREMHLPPRSKKKEDELKALVDHIHHPVRSGFKHPPGSKLDI